MTPEKYKVLQILYKYKDVIPYDYKLISTNFSNGNMDKDTIKYIYWLVKHDDMINVRNKNIPVIRTFHYGECIDENFLGYRSNYTILNENTIYFDGYY